jgi:hypothetical protein
VLGKLLQCVLSIIFRTELQELILPTLPAHVVDGAGQPDAAATGDGDAGPSDAPDGSQHPGNDDATEGHSIAIPPPPKTPCNEALQARVSYILEKESNTGRGMIAELRNNRDYRNPHFMEKIVTLFEISQYGTCFSPSLLDPGALPKEDFLPAIKEHLERQVGPMHASRVPRHAKTF